MSISKTMSEKNHTNTFMAARQTMFESLRDDPDLALAYRANLAMLLHDNFDLADFSNPDTRNVAASMILSLVFSDRIDQNSVNP